MTNFDKKDGQEIQKFPHTYPRLWKNMPKRGEPYLLLLTLESWR